MSIIFGLENVYLKYRYDRNNHKPDTAPFQSFCFSVNPEKQTGMSLMCGEEECIDDFPNQLFIKQEIALTTLIYYLETGKLDKKVIWENKSINSYSNDYKEDSSYEGPF